MRPEFFVPDAGTKPRLITPELPWTSQEKKTLRHEQGANDQARFPPPPTAKLKKRMVGNYRHSRRSNIWKEATLNKYDGI
jgi:hypothetical protein